MSSSAAADLLLQAAFDGEARYRPGQLEAILALVDDRARVLVVQRTGWGKSAVYFAATRLLRNRGEGPTMLISPLLALMRDQVEAAASFGLVARTLDSTNRDEWPQIEAELAADEVDILLVSPERLRSERFRQRTVLSMQKGIGMFVIDEAHCISDWGHDFRPDYRRIKRILAALPAGVPVLATTATANERVQQDVLDQLGTGLDVVRGPLDRPALHMQVVPLESHAERFAWIAEYLSDAAGSGIVYALTVADADRLSGWLASQGLDAPAYHGELDADARVRLESRLHHNEVKALVATVALGMGFDKPDLAFVIHFQRPGSAVSYYQQVGRAGRALARAEAILLSGSGDDGVTDFFIRSAFPPVQDLQSVLAAVEAQEGATVRELEARLNLSGGAIDRALRRLELDGAVLKDGPRWMRTVNPWSADVELFERVTAARRHEQQRMREYVETDGCLMRFVTGELDDPDGTPCGRCENCAEPFAAYEPAPETVEQAQRYLRRAYEPIPPRRQWPSHADDVHGRIPPELQAEEGRVLSRYGDAGWGSIVARDKQRAHFTEELVGAAADMLADWNPDPAPTWVTAMPSLRHSQLVPDFARRLADRLGLPYRDALTKVRHTEPQKDMQNSAQQVRNVHGSMTADPADVEAGPVLLVDDMVDSRWSFTVAAELLLSAGATAVLPLALAKTTSGSA